MDKDDKNNAKAGSKEFIYSIDELLGEKKGEQDIQKINKKNPKTAVEAVEQERAKAAEKKDDEKGRG